MGRDMRHIVRMPFLRVLKYCSEEQPILTAACIGPSLSPISMHSISFLTMFWKVPSQSWFTDRPILSISFHNMRKTVEVTPRKIYRSFEFRALRWIFNSIL